MVGRLTVSRGVIGWWLQAQKEQGAAQFDFLNKKDEPVDGGVDQGFTAAQLAAVDNMDMVVNERCVAAYNTYATAGSSFACPHFLILA